MKFETYKIEDLFNVTSTKSIDAGKLVFVEDGVNFVGRTSVNNGIQGQIEDGFLDYDPNNGDTITVSQVGTMVAIYQDEPYYASQNIAKLTFKRDVMGKRLGLYFTSLINKLLIPFVGYNTPKLVDINNFELTLPATPQGEPDFDFMENYIKEIEQKHIKKLESDLDSRTKNLLTVIGREDLIGDPDGLAAVVAAGFDASGVDYAEFRVGDLFEINPTKAYTQLKDDEIMSGRETPFITTTVSNNGIRGYSDLEPLNKGNSLTASDTTTSDAIFYQADDYIGRSHVQGLQPKFDGFNKNVAMYILTAFRKSADGLYDYGTKFNRDKMRATTIKLPVTPSGSPDLDFMAQYIAYIELKYTHTDAMDERERIGVIKELVKRSTILKKGGDISYG